MWAQLRRSLRSQEETAPCLLAGAEHSCAAFSSGEGPLTGERRYPASSNYGEHVFVGAQDHYVGPTPAKPAFAGGNHALPAFAGSFSHKFNPNINRLPHFFRAAYYSFCCSLSYSIFASISMSAVAGTCEVVSTTFDSPLYER